jgi:hypothetical protein
MADYNLHYIDTPESTEAFFDSRAKEMNSLPNWVRKGVISQVIAFVKVEGFDYYAVEEYFKWQIELLTEKYDAIIESENVGDYDLN